MNISEIAMNPDLKDYRQVQVVFGGDGHEYKSSYTHFGIMSVHSPGFGQIKLVLSDAVAEHYRQEGRRQLQSELRALLNVSRA